MADRDDEERSLPRRPGPVASLQQRFEESRAGEILISVLVVVVLIVGVVRNLPDSPIRRSLLTVAGPVGASMYLNQDWALFAPTVPTRIETIEVQVFMPDGSVRTWTPQLGSPVTGAIAWSRWKRLMANAVQNKPGVREGVSDWAVRRVTDPSERPVRVAMVLKAQTLAPPGQTGTGAVATKVIYEKQLAGRR